MYELKIIINEEYSDIAKRKAVQLVEEFFDSQETYTRDTGFYLIIEPVDLK